MEHLLLDERVREFLGAAVLVFAVTAGGYAWYKMGWRGFLRILVLLTFTFAVTAGGAYAYAEVRGYEQPTVIAAGVGPTDPGVEVEMTAFRLPGPFMGLGALLGLESMMNDPEGLILLLVARSMDWLLAIRNTALLAAFLAALTYAWFVYAWKKGLSIFAEMLGQALIYFSIMAITYNQSASLIGVGVYGGVPVGVLRMFVSRRNSDFAPRHSNDLDKFEVVFGVLSLGVLIAPIFFDQLPHVVAPWWMHIDALMLVTISAVARVPFVPIIEKVTGKLGAKLFVVGAISRIVVINVVAVNAFEHGDIETFSLLTLTSIYSLLIGLPWATYLALKIKSEDKSISSSLHFAIP